MAGFTRVATANIANGLVIDATYLNNEFNAIETAFGTGGHVHDGTAGNGPKLTLTSSAAVSGTLSTANGGTGLSAGHLSAASLIPVTTSAGVFGTYSIGTGLKLSGAVIEHNFTASGAIALSGAQITMAVSSPLAISGSSLQLAFTSAFKISASKLDLASAGGGASIGLIYFIGG